MKTIVIEAGEHSTSFDAQALLEAQFPGARIVSLSRVEELKDRAADQAQIRAVGRSAGLLLTIVFLSVRFAPLLAVFVTLSYWEWGLTGDWHPVFRGLLILCSLLLTACLLAVLLGRMPRALIAGGGALVYFCAVLVAKHLGFFPRGVDWIWAVTIAAGPALVGWWSFASCHDVLSRWATGKTADVIRADHS